MPTTEALQRMYEELANRYARQGEARQRDQCLVLAADAALAADQLDQAERLRKRLLLTNPHHLLRPFHSMIEAMQSTDVQDYVADLRRQWPPDMVEKLVGQTYAVAETGAAPALQPVAPQAPSVPKPAPKPKRAKALREEKIVPASGASSWIALLVFLCGLIVTGGWLVLSLGGPWLE